MSSSDRSRELLAEFGDQLPAREREILELRLGVAGDPLTLAEVGVRFGVTKERVRQIETVAFGKLRELGADG